MSIETMSWTFKNSPYEGRERLVHLAIADVANEDHEYRVFVGDERVAAKAKCSVRTVERTKARMVIDGYLELLIKPAPGRNGEYRFLMPSTADKMSDDSRDVRQEAPERVTGAAPIPLFNVNNGNVTTSRETRDQAFKRIWQRYPRKLNRQGAFRAFESRCREGATIANLALATSNYAQSMAGKEPQFILHGATFFGPNQRWRDYLDGPVFDEAPRARRTSSDPDPRNLIELTAAAAAAERSNV